MAFPDRPDDSGIAVMSHSIVERVLAKNTPCRDEAHDVLFEAAKALMTATLLQAAYPEMECGVDACKTAVESACSYSLSGHHKRAHIARTIIREVRTTAALYTGPGR